MLRHTLATTRLLRLHSHLHVILAVVSGCRDLINTIGRQRVCIIRLLLSSIHGRICIRCWSFQSILQMDFFARWWDRPVTFYVFGCEIINFHSISILSCCLSIDIGVITFLHLMLEFKFIIKITPVVLAPEIMEVVESIIDVFAWTYWQLITGNIGDVALVVYSWKRARYSTRFAREGRSAQTRCTIGLITGTTLTWRILSFLATRAAIRCSCWSRLFYHEFCLFRCVWVVQHFYCCLCSRLIRLRIELMQIQFFKCL